MGDTRTVRGELCQVLAELELCSQVAAVNLEPSGRDAGEDIGGKRPPGGTDRQADRDRENVLKSAAHFRRRMDKAFSERTVTIILHEAEASLVAHRRQPAPRKDVEPQLSSSQWKRYVTESSEKANVLAARFACSRAYVEKVRRAYGSLQT